MPELGALAVGLAALLVIFAWSLIFSRALQAARPHVPGFFGPLFDALQSADTAVYNALRKWADPAVQPLTTLFNRATATAHALTSNPLAFAQAVYASLRRLYLVTVPAAITTALHRAQALYDEATAAARALYDHLGARLDALAEQTGRALAAIRSDLSAVEQWALGLFQSAEHDIQAAAQTVEAAAQAAIDHEAARALDAERAIVADAEGGLQQLALAVQQFVDGAFAGLSSDLVQLAGEFRSGLEAEHQFAVTVEDDARKGLADLEAGPLGQLVEGLVVVGEGLAAQELTQLYALYRKAMREEIALAKTLPAKVAPVLAAARTAIGKP